MSNSRLFWSLAMMALSLAPASHAEIFQTGFESTEGYALGPLSGQNGWEDSAGSTVENSVVYSGSQAVSLDSTGFTGQFLASQPLSYNSIGNPGQPVVFDVHFMAGVGGNGPIWDVLALDGNNGFVGQLLVDGAGNALLGLADTTVGSIAVTPGTWNDFQLVLDFPDRTQTAYVNSQFLGSGPMAEATSSLAALYIGINGADGDQTQTAYFDEISVSSAPEPASGSLVAMSILAWIGFRSRRRSPQA